MAARGEKRHTRGSPAADNTSDRRESSVRGGTQHTPAHRQDSLLKQAMLSLEELPRVAIELSDIDSILQASVALASGAVAADGAYICLADSRNKTIVPRAWHNVDARSFNSTRIRWEDGWSGWVAANEKPLYVSEIAAGAGAEGQEADLALRGAFGSVLAVPVVSPGEPIIGVIGVIATLFHRSGPAGREAEISILQAFASELAFILNRHALWHGPLDRPAEPRREEASGNQQVQQVCERMQTPLTSIRGYAQLATKRQNDMEALRRYAQIILTESQRLAEIVNEYQVGA